MPDSKTCDQRHNLNLRLWLNHNKPPSPPASTGSAITRQHRVSDPVTPDTIHPHPLVLTMYGSHLTTVRIPELHGQGHARLSVTLLQTQNINMSNLPRTRVIRNIERSTDRRLSDFECMQASPVTSGVSTPVVVEWPEEIKLHQPRLNLSVRVVDEHGFTCGRGRGQARRWRIHIDSTSPQKQSGSHTTQRTALKNRKFDMEHGTV